MKHRQLQIELLKGVLEEEFYKGVKLVLINSDTWDFDLPETINKMKQIVIDIKGWTLEQSYVDDEGIFIMTAFGDDEYSRHFSFDEVINVISLEGRLLYQKIMGLDEIQEIPKIPKINAPRKINIKDVSKEGTEYSLMKLLEQNEHLAKYKGKK